MKIVDLTHGANYSPSYLRLNPNGMYELLREYITEMRDVQQLCQLSLSHLKRHCVRTPKVDIERSRTPRYVPILHASCLPHRATFQSVVEFLDKSRSPLSKTNTTSTAPAPALTPATIDGTTQSNKIITDILHSETTSPNTLMLMNARDDESLATHAKQTGLMMQGRSNALAELLTQSSKGEISVSEKVKKLWSARKAAADGLYAVMSQGATATAQLDSVAKAAREEYFASAKSLWEVELKETLTTLTSEIVGPFALGKNCLRVYRLHRLTVAEIGDQLSLADLHLAAWLARVCSLSGATMADNGETALAKLEAHIGNGFTLSKDFVTSATAPRPAQSKLAAFWDVMSIRPSWNSVYADGLH